MMPFAAAMSRRFAAMRTASALSGVPTVSRASLTRDLSSVRTARLRSVRFALVMMRFF